MKLLNMKNKTDQNMEQAILEAAEHLFLEKGYAATSTTQIAKAVGCNQALVHYYFRTKDNLFNTIFESKFKLFFKNIFDTTQLAGMSFQQKIKHIVEAHFDLLMQNPRLPILILNELSRRPEQLNTLREKLHDIPEQLFTIMNQELETEIAAGRVKELSYIDIVITIVSLNVALFSMLPIASELIKLCKEQRNLLLVHRRSENVDIVLSYIRP